MKRDTLAGSAAKTRLPLILLILTLASSVVFPGTVRLVKAEAVTGTIAVGNNPDGIAVDTGLNRIYVSNYGLNGTFPSTVSVINGSNNSLMATILVGVNPGGIALNSATHRVYVANYNSSSVSVIDGTTNSVVATVGVGSHPSKVAVNTTTNEIYVTNNGDNTVSRIDGITNTVVGTIPVGKSPGGITLLQSTNTIYVANSRGNTASVINGTTHTVVTTIPVGNDPGNIASDSATKLIYVVDTNVSMVSVIDGSTNSLVGNISVGGFPSGVDVNISTNKIYVANSADGTLSVVDGFTSQEVNTVMLPNGAVPSAVGVNPLTNTIYVANDGPLKTLSIISGHATGTSLICNPSSVPVSGQSICTASVHDLSGSGTSAPTGIIFFASNGQGIFNATSCNLTGTGITTTCSVSYSPTTFGSGHQTIFATYGGDRAHMSNSTNTIISLNNGTVGGFLVPTHLPYPTALLTDVLLFIWIIGLALYSVKDYRKSEPSTSAQSTAHWPGGARRSNCSKMVLLR